MTVVTLALTTIVPLISIIGLVLSKSEQTREWIVNYIWMIAHITYLRVAVSGFTLARQLPNQFESICQLVATLLYIIGLPLYLTYLWLTEKKHSGGIYLQTTDMILKLIFSVILVSTALIETQYYWLTVQSTFVRVQPNLKLCLDRTHIVTISIAILCHESISLTRISCLLLSIDYDFKVTHTFLLYVIIYIHLSKS